MQRTGDTMAPSFFSRVNALSTSLRSSPERVATSPADTGLPALRMVLRTFAVVSISYCLIDNVVSVLSRDFLGRPDEDNILIPQAPQG